MNPPVIWDISTDPVLAGAQAHREAWIAGGLLSSRDFRRRFLEGMELAISGMRPFLSEG